MGGEGVEGGCRQGGTGGGGGGGEGARRRSGQGPSGGCGCGNSGRSLLVTPLRVAAPEVPEPPPEEAGGDLPGLEREDDIVVQEREAAPPSPTGADQGSRPSAPPVQPARGEPAVRTDLVVRSPSRQRAGKATSAPDPQKAAGSSSSAQDVETASASSGGRRVVGRPC